MHTAIQPAGDHGRPAIQRDFGLQMDFAAVARLGGAALLQNAAVQFRAQAEAMPAFAPLEANPAKALLSRQFAHGHFQRFACFVEFQTVKI